jgi:hypothetical protein
MEAVFQTQILGSATSTAHWSLPHEGKNDAELNMIRHMINQAYTIIEASFPPGHPLQQKLLQAIHSYQSAIKLLNCHYHLWDFFTSWVEVCSVQGVTNYIHLIGSGYMQYFLQNYGCLYLYSQQG